MLPVHTKSTENVTWQIMPEGRRTGHPQPGDQLGTAGVDLEPVTPISGPAPKEGCANRWEDVRRVCRKRGTDRLIILGLATVRR